MKRKWFVKFIHIFVSALVLLTFLLPLLTGMVKAAVPTPDQKPEVEPALSMQLNADQTSGYLIYFKEQADLSQ